MEMILYQYPSPLGIMLLTMEDNSFTDICLTPSSTHEHWHPYPPLSQPYANDLDQYFKGVPVALDWPITLKGTPFQKRVWQKLREIPYGHTTTYRQIGEALDTKGYRAVGGAVGANPLMIVVPCHRVLGSSGLGGYAYGLKIKQFLLNLERITHS
ncbi:MAG: methylated-DNA--[protein]-cysteine S-methyltransferase [Limnochordia bacterium]|jgi:O-6-methylguanine DNA methyltransferase